MRSQGIDRLRGLAIVCMIVDHLALLIGDLDWARLTVGRVAMPLFFLLAGHLAHRLSWRLVGIGAAGAALPFYVTWVDSPNVLLWIAVGIPVVVLLGRYRLELPGILVCLAVAANGGLDHIGTSYPPVLLLGIMLLGRLVPRESLVVVGDRLPAVLQLFGKYPLSIYIGHTVLLQTVVLLAQ